jgi:hypothetical protein
MDSIEQPNKQNLGPEVDEKFISIIHPSIHPSIRPSVTHFIVMPLTPVPF